ncbi:MAG: hypothetical protein ACXWC1_29540 [Burkholderiales bacterium]
MPTNIKIIHARDFVTARPGGILDLEASEKLLADIASASTSLDGFQVLLDTRRALAVLSTFDLWRLAQKLTQDHMSALQKTAVLCPQERFDHASFFSAICAEGRGLNIRAFLSYEDAMEWLIKDDDHPSTKSSEGRDAVAG